MLSLFSISRSPSPVPGLKVPGHGFPPVVGEARRLPAGLVLLLGFLLYRRTVLGSPHLPPVPITRTADPGSRHVCTTSCVLSPSSSLAGISAEAVPGPEEFPPLPFAGCSAGLVGGLPVSHLSVVAVGLCQAPPEGASFVPAGVTLPVLVPTASDVGASVLRAFAPTHPQPSTTLATVGASTP